MVLYLLVLFLMCSRCVFKASLTTISMGTFQYFQYVFKGLPNHIASYQGLNMFYFSVRMNVKRASGVLVVHPLVLVSMGEG